MSSTPLSGGELSAMGTIARARKDNLRTMFEGTRFTFSKYAREKTTKDVLHDAKKLKKAGKKIKEGIETGSQVPSGVSQAGEIQANCREMIGIAADINYTDVMHAVGSEVMTSLVAEMMPIVGVIISSAKAVQSWRSVVEEVRDLNRSATYLEGVLPGDPSAAAQAVIEVIQRFLAAHSADAARNTAAAGIKIAGLFADMGTATTAAAGAASTLAKLIQELAIVGRDYKEMQAANALLEDPSKLDFNVFKVSPTLGCYLISCSDTSMVVNFCVADMGLPGWMDKVEAMKKNQLDPLIKYAKRGIVSSHLTLDGLKANKGTMEEKSTLDKVKDNVKHHFNELIKSNATRAANP
jgi:hypothetical protein